MPTLDVKTLGCKVNLSDSHALINQLKKTGFEYKPGDADLVIVNTCSVTSAAEREARNLARKIKRKNPNTHLVLTGCYAQTDSSKLLEIDAIDYIVPNSHKDRAAELIHSSYLGNEARMPKDSHIVKDNRQNHFKSAEVLFSEAQSDKSRAFLKVQDGCDGFCSYCLIPYARGSSRSVEQNKIVSEINSLVSKGYKEAVITGIHVGDYGKDKDSSLAKLLVEIFENTELHRLRISSLEPGEISDELCDVISTYRSRMCEHFHLPLQSGSDKILKKMNRSYDKAHYFERIHKLRSLFPNANIGADVIVGFPGEGDQEFADTKDFINICGLNYLHVFSYSKRNNTAAIKFSGHLSKDTISERATTLRSLDQKMKLKYLKSQVGTSQNAIWQTSMGTESVGLTGNYIKVKSPRQFEAKSIQAVELIGLSDSETFRCKPV